MKQLFIISFLSLLSCGFCYSQLHENGYPVKEWFINAGVGPINYTGDLLDKRFSTRGMQVCGSIGMTYQRTPHVSFNASLMAGKVRAFDSKNGPKWFYRNLSFHTSIYAFEVNAQYDLYDITEYDNSFADKNTQNITPYIFVGVGVYHFNPYAYDTTGKKIYLQPLGTEGQKTPYPLWSMSIPYGIGIKYSFREDGLMMLSAELCVRKLFTDYLDDVSKHEYPDSASLLASRGPIAVEMSYRANEIPNSRYVKANGYRGNPYKKDGYYSLEIKFAYKLFTHKPKFYYGY